MSYPAVPLALGLAFALPLAAQGVLSGESRQWHPLTLTVEGPPARETGTPNPFLDYRMSVLFRHAGSGSECTVPGYFAADGNAAETSATSGNRWRAHFSPDQPGEWSYRVSLRAGPNLASSAAADEGQPAAGDGLRGRFTVRPTDKRPPDFRASGRLRHTGGRYLQFAHSGRYFLKGGADSPENFLACADFDQPAAAPALAAAREGEARRVPVHTYAPHARDWRPGDPSWQAGKGRNLIGALNYLAAKGMNSVYCLTMNVGGDGDDVWPWIAKTDRLRFDCSKLDQWEIVFSHMDRRGLQLHAVTQETENDHLLDGGELGPERRLYYRELVARFAHHLGVVWNLGEENTNSDPQRRDFARWIRSLDAYRHPIVVHTYPGQYDRVYEPLLGFDAFDGPSLQMADMERTHAETLKWVRRSAATGRPWMVCLDEVGPADTGVKPDRDDPDHDAVRKLALWGNLMAGGAGCEWYFGYKYPHNDLACEDWRSRDRMWDQTRYALEFFQRHLPFDRMRPGDELISDPAAYCLAEPGRVYAVYLPQGGDVFLELAPGAYTLKWYNPRQGGRLQDGSLRTLRGPGRQPLGKPPRDPGQDWVALATQK